MSASSAKFNSVRFLLGGRLVTGLASTRCSGDLDQHRREVIGRERLAAKKTLDLIAAVAAEELELLFRFDALCYDVQAQLP